MIVIIPIKITESTIAIIAEIYTAPVIVVVTVAPVVLVH